MEKFIVEPKHVEVQLMGDHFGNVLHLYERDCSCQRRNQKLLEEAQCHTLDANTRNHLLQDAVNACKAVGYDSVGTIEFLLDARGQYYFMEMNTRIQVEHPVTEWVTGLDLVKEQLRIASGEKLPFSQKDIHIQGHAIECRINAENPWKNFRPSPGTITDLHLPGGQGIRVDTGIYSGYQIPPYYDSMLAKLIVHGDNREEAIAKMKSALGEMIIQGVDTNIDYQFEIMNDPDYQKGVFDIGFLESHQIGGVKVNEA